jgi:hypothetical protein
MPACIELQRAIRERRRFAHWERELEQEDAGREEGGRSLSGLLRACVDHFVPRDPHVRRDPVNADPEGGAGAEEVAEEGVKGVEEVLAGLGFGGRKGDYSGLAICEDVNAHELGGTLDDVEG